MDHKQEAYECQMLLEELYNKHETKRYVRNELKQYVEAVKDEEYKSFVLELMVNIFLLKRAKMNILVGIMRSYKEDIKEVVSTILKAEEDEFILYDERRDDYVTAYIADEEMQENLNRYQYPLPMVIEPRRLTNNHDTGYIRDHSSCLLKNSYHEKDICLDHLNRINKIKFCINWDTANNIQNTWKNIKKKEGETDEEHKAKVKQFEKYQRDTWFVMHMMEDLSDYFYFCHGYDKRGRCYPKGYHLNYTGTDWNKAVIEFYNKEKCL